MTEIPKEALEKADDLAMEERNEHSLETGAHHFRDALARYIADVSEKAKEAEGALGLYLDQTSRIRTDLRSLILPNPEDDLLKEAREICARDAEEQGCSDVADRYRTGVSDRSMPMRCTLAALRRNR